MKDDTSGLKACPATCNGSVVVAVAVAEVAIYCDPQATAANTTAERGPW